MSCETFLSSLSVTWPVLPCGLARPRHCSRSLSCQATSRPLARPGKSSGRSGSESQSTFYSGRKERGQGAGSWSWGQRATLGRAWLPPPAARLVANRRGLSGREEKGRVWAVRANLSVSGVQGQPAPLACAPGF